MKIPAAIARSARITLSPPIESKEKSPVRISQMANKRNPIFFVNLILSPSFIKIESAIA